MKQIQEDVTNESSAQIERFMLSGSEVTSCSSRGRRNRRCLMSRFLLFSFNLCFIILSKYIPSLIPPIVCSSSCVSLYRFIFIILLLSLSVFIISYYIYFLLFFLSFVSFYYFSFISSLLLHFIIQYYFLFSFVYCFPFVFFN